MIDSPSIREAVREAYSAAARQPETKHAFPIGRSFAESVGYPGDLLDSLPANAVEAFAGVSNVSLFAGIAPKNVVLDLGCGAGLDALIAARRTGPCGKVYAVDFSESMLERARHAGVQAGAENVEFLRTDAEQLPLPDASIDVALVNGIFNLNPNRAAILRELARVVRPGGQVFGAELILAEPLPPSQQACPTNWFA